MDYDRGGKRGRSPNRRFTNRGYRRGNVRGNYYPWRPSWSHNNHYNTHYLYPPRPPKPPSPLPGTEEYRQRNIQQTSELIKKQLNIDGSMCNDFNVDLKVETKTTDKDVTEQRKEETPQTSVSTDQKKPKNKKSQVQEEEIDVQEIYDKIIKHISNLSHSKKLHLINQSNSGYDIAIQQIQKQKQLELSKALRDMSQRPILDTDEEVIQSIIPDIGIKIEDLPNDVIKELSKTLQVKFESDYDVSGNKMDVDESTKNQVIDMTISPDNSPNNSPDNSRKIVQDNKLDNSENIINKKIDSEIEPEQEINDGLIDNIFDFEYLNKTENDEDSFVASKNEIVESEFSFANIDVTKSYLDMPMSLDLPKKSGCGLIRVKTDIFETSLKENPKTLLGTPVFTGKLCPGNIKEIIENNVNISTDSTQTTIDNENKSNNKNKNSSPNPILEEENLEQNNSSSTTVLNVVNETEQIKSTVNSGPSNENVDNSIITNQNKIDSNEGKINSPLSSSSSSFERLLIQPHFSPLIRDVQTPPNQLINNQLTIEQPKKWKSPGEKKMLPVENNHQSKSPSSTEINQQLNLINEPKEVAAEKKIEDKNLNDDKNKFKKKKKQKSDKNDKSEKIDKIDKNEKNDKNEKINKIENENKQTKNSKISQNNLPITISSKEIGTMVNFDSKHKRKKKTNVEVQTDKDSMLLFKPEVKDVSTITDFTKKLITVSAQTPIKFFKKNYQTKSIQTIQINGKNVEVQATEKMKTVSIQTDKESSSDDYKKKNTALLSQLKLMQQIDEEIRELLIKKKSLYDNLELLTKDVQKPDSKSYSNKKRKSKKHDKNERNEKNCDKMGKIEKLFGESINRTDQIKTNENESNLRQNEVENLNQIETNIDFINTEQEVQDITMKIKPKSHIKDLKEKERSQQSPIQKEQQFKQSPILTSKDTDSSKEKPLKLSLKIEKDENNVKKYTLKRDRSLSKDKETKPSSSTSSITEETEDTAISNAPADKRYKISKDIEKLVYNDNKFLKKCCVKLKPLKSNEYVKENSFMENEYEKTFDHLEESSRSPSVSREVHSGRESSGIPESIGETAHSLGLTSTSVPAKQKSKIIDKLEFKGLTGSIFSLKVIDENLLAAGDNGILYIYNVVSQELIATIHLSTQALTCLHVTKALNNNECLIYVGCLDGQLRVVNFLTKELQETVNVESPIQCMDICWGIVFIGSTTGDLTIYDTKASKLEDSIHIFDNRIYTIKAMQEGPRRVLLIGTKDTELSIRDAMTGLLMREFKTNFSPTIYSILVEHNLVYCGTNQHDVLAYSFQDGELLKRYEGIASRRVICMQIVNNLLFVGCFNGSVCVFHKTTHQYLGHMIRPGESLLSMIIVNNKVIVGLKNNKLVIWDVPEVYLEKNR